VGEKVGSAVGAAVALQVVPASFMFVKPSRQTQWEVPSPLSPHIVVPVSQPWEPSSHGCSVGILVGVSVGWALGTYVGAAVGTAVAAQNHLPLAVN
jgi:hypothetical protein